MKVKVVFLLILLFFLFIGVWIIKQRQSLTYKSSAKASNAQIYLLPDQVTLTKDETVIFDVVIDSNASISSALVQIPFNKDNLKLTKYSFSSSPLTLSLDSLSLSEANKQGRVIISRALNPRLSKRYTSHQFLLASLWFTIVNDDKRILELTPDVYSLTDTAQNVLSPIDVSGSVIDISSATTSVSSLTSPTIRPTISLNTIPTPIIVTEDSYISQTQENEILGKETALKIHDEPEAMTFLKFDLRTLSKKPVSLALLRLFNAERPVGTFRVTEAPNSWSENRLTYLNRPPLGKVLAKNDEVVTGGWIDTDITEFVRTNVGKIVSLRLDSPDGGELVFSSKENSTNQPYILVQ